MPERLHEPNEIADLRADRDELLEAMDREEENAREVRDALLHFGQNWQRRAEVAEGRIEQAMGMHDSEDLEDPETGMDYWRDLRRIRAILSEPANAERIASEGGSASAANPPLVEAGAPSAEAGQPSETEKDARALYDDGAVTHLSVEPSPTGGEAPSAEAGAGELAETLDAETVARYHAAVAQHDKEHHG